MKLTDIERFMLERLKLAQALYWVDLDAAEVRTLNRLVTKGVAVRDSGKGGRICWKPAS